MGWFFSFPSEVEWEIASSRAEGMGQEKVQWRSARGGEGHLHQPHQKSKLPKRWGNQREKSPDTLQWCRSTGFTQEEPASHIYTLLRTNISYTHKFFSNLNDSTKSHFAAGAGSPRSKPPCWARCGGAALSPCQTPAHSSPSAATGSSTWIYCSRVPSPNTPTLCSSKTNNNNGEGLEQFSAAPEPENSRVRLAGFSVLGEVSGTRCLVFCLGQWPTSDTSEESENKPIMHLSQLCDAVLGLGRFVSGNITARITAVGKQTRGKSSRYLLPETRYQNASFTCATQTHQQKFAE